MEYYYIFVLNDITIKNNLWKADMIMKYLIEKGIWALPYSAPNIKHFTIGQKSLIYLAGNGRRCFVGSFTINSVPYKNKDVIGEPESEWLSYFPIRIEITDTKIWDKNIIAKDVKDKLNFIYDKKNWGLFFRQSNRIIDEIDYQLITEELNECKPTNRKKKVGGS